ncbi:aminoglycoside phosphotransferase family protein [Leifsonia sp. YAF41]|uniref:aminoglycoside phosphotransferase family protein n=1 Tax=Leifsonia sp. YAF41 TaxID=3233086 RepID=UPI003F99BBF5
MRAGESDEIELPGGGTTTVVKVGDTVRRPTREWTPAVHLLLTHVAEHGFRGAPRVLGTDGSGREMLEFVPGEVGNYPLSASVRSETALVTAARLLREFHDATVDRAETGLAGLQHDPLEPVEVVCHGDFAPYNVVFRAASAVAMIDFDHARLGPRAWDLAYALYRFAPMSLSFGATDDFSDSRVQARRARAFLDAYGCDRESRREAIGMVAPRLDALASLMRASAAAGDENFARHIDDGHLDIYLGDIDYIESHEAIWQSVID